MAGVITGGSGVLAANLGDQTVLSVQGKRARFRGAWYCSLAGTDEMIISIGYVNGLEPFIGTKRMSGIGENGKPDRDGPPRLKLKSDLFDKTGHSRICVQVLVDSDGKMKADKDLTPSDLCLVQHPTAESDNELVGLFAVAILRRTTLTPQASFGELRQIAYFDQRHSTRQPVQGPRRHFFSPAA